ncbi:hypothetical protein SAMN02910340_02162 [Methanosarcina thermophila]|jgi:hypothetical protein|uniref:Uncharacterized protein n=1 Tax=Methanosarcina thermophila TaxID=2210 RepID=A0A1I7AJD3_METTE|nr:MAG: hypothetical protein AAY43_10165 [Methanosarcina sp. 795]SFT75000.1 hypothetical protein SAMN02910340_02162 [Methanosarcina thermophila]
MAAVFQTCQVFLAAALSEFEAAEFELITEVKSASTAPAAAKAATAEPFKAVKVFESTKTSSTH